MQKKLVVVMITFVAIITVFTGMSQAIPVNFSSATHVTTPYPYTHADTLLNSDDIDYYKFWANAGQTLAADIDNGYDGSDGTKFTAFTDGVDIDTTISLFNGSVSGFIPYPTFGSNCDSVPYAADGGCLIDSGSFETYIGSGKTNDPYIASYLIGTTGWHYLAVSTNENFFDENAGEFYGDTFSGGGRFPNGGTYTLILNLTPVPEPSTALLFSLGVISLLIISRSYLLPMSNKK